MIKNKYTFKKRTAATGHVMNNNLGGILSAVVQLRSQT